MLEILSSLCSHAAFVCRICPIASIIKIDLLLQTKGLTRARARTASLRHSAARHYKQAFSGTCKEKANPSAESWGFL